MTQISHRTVETNGIRMHMAEQGTGPLVVLCHGFPESWYSWRHQLPALAEAGFHAVAPDMRGYGRTDRPEPIDQYTLFHLIGDMVGLLDALGAEQAVIAGHDWGAPIAACSALLRPDIFTAVAMLSVPYSPPGGRRPTEAFAEMGRLAGQDEEFYINYFQEPGRAEREAEIDVRSWLLGLYVAASADGMRPASGGGTIATVARGTMLRDRFPAPGPLPGWLTEDDLGFYAGEFERTGFRGALNRYRNVDRDWQDLQPWRGAPIRVPSLFIGGEKDGPTMWGAGAIARFPDTLPDLRGSHILPGCGHWVQQERADEVNRLLVDWLKSL